jgi:hypothetical protein
MKAGKIWKLEVENRWGWALGILCFSAPMKISFSTGNTETTLSLSEKPGQEKKRCFAA